MEPLPGRSRFQSVFDLMGCSSAKAKPFHLETVSPPMGVYCKQITVMPQILKHRVSTHSIFHQRRKPIKPSFDISRTDVSMLRGQRDNALITTYSKANAKQSNKGCSKVYLSQTQSATMNYMGQMLPCAPPATPMPEVLRHVEYIPSLADIKAQRSLRDKLVDIDNQKKKKYARLKEEATKREAEKKKEDLVQLRTIQRSQIYALNAAMKDLEQKRFKMFQQQIDKS